MKVTSHLLVNYRRIPIGGQQAGIFDLIIKLQYHYELVHLNMLFQLIKLLKYNTVNVVDERKFKFYINKIYYTIIRSPTYIYASRYR